jgi:hypothetical protein
LISHIILNAENFYTNKNTNSFARLPRVLSLENLRGSETLSPGLVLEKAVHFGRGWLHFTASGRMIRLAAAPELCFDGFPSRK